MQLGIDAARSPQPLVPEARSAGNRSRGQTIHLASVGVRSLIAPCTHRLQVVANALAISMHLTAHRHSTACALQLCNHGRDLAACGSEVLKFAAEDTSGASTSEGHPTTPPLSRMGSSRLYTVPESSVAEEDTEAAYEAARQSDTPADFRRRCAVAPAHASVHGSGHITSPACLRLRCCNR